MDVGGGSGLRLRDMTADDLAAAHNLSREAKWPHRLEDWDLMLRVGQGIVAERDGEVIGTILGWPYGPAAATLGMVIVAETARGGGVGRKLMDAMIERLGERAIQLNATPDGLRLYKSLGFEPVGSLHQHQGTAFSAPIARLRPEERVRPLGASDIAAVAALDGRANGLERAELLAKISEHAQGVVLDRGGEVTGFALFRRFGRGYVVGPVVARDRDGARTLIAHWLGSNSGKFIRIDVPGDCGLIDWLQDLGLTGVDRVVTMVRGELPAHGRDAATFAIASQALG